MAGNARENFIKDLYSYLTGNNTVKAVLGTAARVYHVRSPQSPQMPCAVYHIISGDEYTAHDGTGTLQRVLVQVDCMASGAITAAQARDAIKTALHTYVGTIGSHTTVAASLYNGESEDYDDELGIYQCSIEFMITFTES